MEQWSILNSYLNVSSSNSNNSNSMFYMTRQRDLFNNFSDEITYSAVIALLLSAIGLVSFKQCKDD